MRLLIKLSLSLQVELAVVCVARFINARRRIVQPMIDQSNRAGEPNAMSHSYTNHSFLFCQAPQALHKYYKRTHGDVLISLILY